MFNEKKYRKYMYSISSLPFLLDKSLLVFFHAPKIYIQVQHWSNLNSKEKKLTFTVMGVKIINPSLIYWSYN